MVGHSQRKIALAVSSWTAESTLYSWWFTKAYLLRKQSGDPNVALDPCDELFIVHVASPKGIGKKSAIAWETGGPLVHSLQESLQRYPHKVVELTGNQITAATLDWAESEGIDILVMGFRDAKVKQAMTKVVPGEWGLGSVSARTLQHTKVPLLIVRPDAALKLNKLRIQSSTSLSTADQSDSLPSAEDAAAALRRSSALPGLVRTLSPGHMRKYEPADARKVGLAFEQEDAGRLLLQWAAKVLLQPNDQVFVAHIISKAAQGTSGSAPAGPPNMAASVSRAASLKPTLPPLPDDDVDEGPATGDELTGFDVVLDTRMQGDPRDKICEFATEQGLDLLVVGRSLGSRFKKAFTPGGTVSQHVVSHAACPVLVFPQKVTGMQSPDALSPRVRRRSSEMAAGQVPGGAATAVRPPSAPFIESPSEVDQLRQQLAARDEEITSLKAKLQQLQTGSLPAAGAAMDSNAG